MTVLVYSPKFTDTIIDQPIEIACENSCKFVHEIGGMARILSGDYPMIKEHCFSVNYFCEKGSIILTGDRKKTTITQKLEPVALVAKNNDAESSVLLVSYAEDLNWTTSSFLGFEGSTAVVDFSGRYSNVKEAQTVMSFLKRHFNKSVLLITEHDAFSIDDLILLADDSVTIVYHSPAEITYWNQQLTFSVVNSYYISLGIDFVGYGDYLALLICQAIHEQSQIDPGFFTNYQRLTRNHIDARKI